jgi:hypothetical protein
MHPLAPMVGAPLSINYSLFSMTWVLGGGAMRPRAPMVRVLLVGTGSDRTGLQFSVTQADHRLATQPALCAALLLYTQSPSPSTTCLRASKRRSSCCLALRAVACHPLAPMVRVRFTGFSIELNRDLTVNITPL